MKRTMISAAFAIALLACSGANANASAGPSDPMVNIAIKVVSKVISGWKSTISSEPSPEGRESYNASQKTRAATLANLASSVDFGKITDNPDHKLNFAVTLTQDGSYWVTVTKVHSNGAVLSITTAIIDQQGEVFQQWTSDPRSADWSHGQNGSSGSSSRGDNGRSESGSESM